MSISTAGCICFRETTVGNDTFQSFPKTLPSDSQRPYCTTGRSEGTRRSPETREMHPEQVTNVRTKVKVSPGSVTCMGEGALRVDRTDTEGR